MIVLVHCYANSGGGGADPWTSISDDLGNTWTPEQTLKYDPGAASAGLMVRIYSTPQDVGTLTTSTVVTFGGVPATTATYAFIQFAGDAGSTLAVVGGAIGTGSSTSNPTITTSSIPSGDAVVGVVGVRYAGTAYTWTADSDTSNGSWSTAQLKNSTGLSNPSWALCSQFKVVTGTGTQTYNPTLSTSLASGPAWVQIHETAGAIGDVFAPFAGGGFFP